MKCWRLFTECGERSILKRVKEGLACPQMHVTNACALNHAKLQTHV